MGISKNPEFQARQALNGLSRQIESLCSLFGVKARTKNCDAAVGMKCEF
jgi:hypothetical protein